MSWALTCGGVISRTVYGYADFGAHQPYSTHESNFSTNPADANTVAFLCNSSTTTGDVQADLSLLILWAMQVSFLLFHKGCQIQ
jgi:hypothetical protein